VQFDDLPQGEISHQEPAPGPAYFRRVVSSALQLIRPDVFSADTIRAGGIPAWRVFPQWHVRWVPSAKEGTT
jgi:hypothetical protein